MEEDPGGAEGHSGSAPAARRQGQRSSEGGEARFLSAHRQFGTNTTRPAKEQDEKPLSAYKCH